MFVYVCMSRYVPVQFLLIWSNRSPCQLQTIFYPWASDILFSQDPWPDHGTHNREVTPTIMNHEVTPTIMSHEVTRGNAVTKFCTLYVKHLINRIYTYTYIHVRDTATEQGPHAHQICKTSQHWDVQNDFLRVTETALNGFYYQFTLKNRRKTSNSTSIILSFKSEYTTLERIVALIIIIFEVWRVDFKSKKYQIIYKKKSQELWNNISAARVRMLFFVTRVYTGFEWCVSARKFAHVKHQGGCSTLFAVHVHGWIGYH